MELPIFKYHPDPIKTGAIEVTSATCECCDIAQGYRATSTIYAEEEIQTICPWCIANGSAAEKFDGEFTDSHPLLKAGLDTAIVKEVCERTPCFNSWQQEVWLSHCNDACEFHGDADKLDLLEITGTILEAFLDKQQIDQDIWQKIVTSYEKGGNPSVYKFKCRICGMKTYGMDFV